MGKKGLKQGSYVSSLMRTTLLGEETEVDEAGGPQGQVGRWKDWGTVRGQ
jgi:hypothetical protein